MVRSDLSNDKDVSTIERTAAVLEVGEVSHVARAVLDVAGRDVVCGGGDRPTEIAAVRIANRRTGGRELDVESASDRFDVDPEAVLRAEAALVEQLDDPAPADVRTRLRRTIVGIREVLFAAENGRAVAPRLPKSVADVDPALAAISGRSLEDVRLEALRDYGRRLEADFEAARLGVALYAAVQDASVHER